MSLRDRRLLGRLAAGCLAALIISPAQAALLRIGNAGEPETLDPQRYTHSWEDRILGELYEPLVATDAKGQLIPGLASHWHVTPDGLTYTFHLRDAIWSDGTPITADDAVFALQRLVLPETRNANVSLYYALENAREINAGTRAPQTLGAHAPDAHTLVITLSEPAPYLLCELSVPYAAPLPRHVLKTLSDTTSLQDAPPVVSGAYRLDHWTPRVEVFLRKNVAFFDADNVAIDEVAFYPVEDAAESFNLFRTNALDISYNNIPTFRLRSVRDELGDEVKVFPVLGEYAFLMNQSDDSPLRDRRIREALNLAISRETLSAAVQGWNHRPAYSLVPRIMAGNIEGEMYFAHWPMDIRLDRARRLLKDAGYGPRHPLEVELSYNTLDLHQRIATLIAEMWKPLGINTRFVARGMKDHYAAMDRHQFQIGRISYIANADDPIEMMNVYTSSATDNRSGYHNPQYDHLMDDAQRTHDPAYRKQLLTQAQQMLLDDMAFLPIFDLTAAQLVSHRLTGWEPNGINIHPIRFMRKHDKS